MSVKENGCIIFVSAFNDNLLVTSKHSINAPIVRPESGSNSVDSDVRDHQDGVISDENETIHSAHAAKGEEWLNRHLRESKSSITSLIHYLQVHNITAVFELADDNFEEHILEYPEGRRGLYLHGINENTPILSTWDYNSGKLHEFAKTFGFRIVECEIFQTLEETFEFVSKHQKTGFYGNRPVEGFVVRCNNNGFKLNDNMNTDTAVAPYESSSKIFFKIKFDEPYMMFREYVFRLVYNGSVYFYIPLIDTLDLEKRLWLF